jgi:hypothetical protein
MALYLIDKCYLSHTSSPFCFSYFWIASLFFFFLLRLAWTVILLLIPPMQLGLQKCTTTPGLFIEMGGGPNFLPRLASICNPSDLHFPRSWDHSHEPLNLAETILKWISLTFKIQ